MLIRIDHHDGMFTEMYWCRALRPCGGPSWLCLDFSEFGEQVTGAVVDAAWNSDDVVFDLERK